MTIASAFTPTKCIERLRHAYERYGVVRRSLGDMADDFLRYDSLQGKPLEQILLHMADTLPEPLLVRALAKEGLSLIEQITWEVYICENSPEFSRKPEQSSALTALANAVQAEKPFMEQTIEQMNSLIQLSMDAPDRMEVALKNALKSETK